MKGRADLAQQFRRRAPFRGPDQFDRPDPGWLEWLLLPLLVGREGWIRQVSENTWGEKQLGAPGEGLPPGLYCGVAGRMAQSVLSGWLPMPSLRGSRMEDRPPDRPSPCRRGPGGLRETPLQ
eukprot:scaffold334929_cov39-Prasinocladus_malaysianus.AAC.1